jgi:4-hydroxy-2-oxoheptanedioate aldolase
MELPTNVFKRALREGRPQIGLWVGLADAYVAELLATVGFDCLVIDAEHAPNDPRSVLPQLQAMAPYPVHPIVRPVSASVELIKQYLDIGAQTLIIPMVAGSAAPWHVPRAGIRSTTMSGAATKKCACSSKWSPSTL